MNKILLVEDNPKVSYLNKEILEEEGYFVSCAFTIADAKKLFDEDKPDIVILDVGMPDGSGLSFLDSIREETNIPVLMLTGFSRDEDIVRAFNRGCDDYLAKPYSIEVLLVRIKRLLQVMKRSASNITVGRLTVDQNANKAYIDNTDLLLTQQDFALLKMLVLNEDKEITFEKIFREVWNSPINSDTRAVVSAISRLRKKISDSGYAISAVYGVGYRFSKIL